MYEFLFDPYILRCLNYIWIFIWSMYFKVLETMYEFLFVAWNFFMYFKIPYDFMIYFYDPSLLLLFRAELKICF
jgi:hypothetical protein